MPIRNAARRSCRCLLAGDEPANMGVSHDAESYDTALGGDNSPLYLSATREEDGRRFLDLLELLPQTVFETDLEGWLTLVNRHALEMFGYSREEFEAGKRCFDMLAPEERHRARERFRRILEGQPVEAMEYLARRKDGTRFPALFYSAAIVQDQSPVGLRGVIIGIAERNLTERRQAEEALRESEAKYRSLVETIRDVVWAVDADGRVTFINQAAEQTYGRPAREVLGPNQVNPGRLLLLCA